MDYRILPNTPLRITLFKIGFHTISRGSRRVDVRSQVGLVKIES